ncbi:GEVED domain-containing protein [Epilithonimonas pallida]|uniref:Por secretion system C-terminal sorting domain-containing protein n=1 Tax=Epilithonimonas pallida TaxID=373671 RepID=A0ABY1R4C2_9FLAO|nr:T9SS type A sorting domain-containing protein [Epilithonimonas pallida]SMP94213.1 Por secretion system C-terminal sorting domain-containing protein [Epilithonimonas pallida]
MKKILFSCLLAMGIGVNAQYDFTQDFESPIAGSGYYQFGGGSTSTAQFCSGTTSGALTYSSTVTQTGWMADVAEVGDLAGQVGNGQQVNVSFKYKKAAGLTGTLYVMYALFDEAANSWSITTVGTGVALTSAAVTTCGTVSATIPAGVIDPDKRYGIGTWLQRTGSTTGVLYIDDLVIKQDAVTTAPACTAFTTPTTGSTISAGTVALKWNTVATATKYKVTVGTTPGASDVLNTTVAGNLTSTNVSLMTNTTYYAKIVSTNTVGDATGCQEITFSTNTTVAHCGPLTSTAPAAIAPIKSVSFSGTTNTSDPTATTIGSFPVHQNFTATEFVVKSNVTSVPLTVLGTTNGNAANGWAMSAFIDWNNDGDFDDAGEQYFNTFATKVYVGGVTANPVTLTGNITIPAGTSFGKKFMRVKYNFQSTAAATLNTPLLTACNDMINGQVEDYTIDYQEFLAVSDVNKKSVSVYPNPFTDVLNISDVKGVKSVSVNDISGREVKTLAPAAELNLSNLKSGLYIVNLKMEDGSIKTFKAIKK